MIYSIITAVCLALMAGGALLVLLNIIFKKRAERIAYVRRFKKGKSALIYMIAIPLFWEGMVYSGQTVAHGFFGAIQSAIELIVLKFNFADVSALTEANALYAVTVYICCVLVILNAILFTLSLASQYLWSFFHNVWFWRVSRKDKLIIFGNNESNCTIYQSEKKRVKVVADRIGDRECETLYMRNVVYTQVVSFGEYVSRIVGKCAKTGRAFVVVINTEDDEKNLEIGNCFVRSLAALDNGQRARCFGKLRVFLFGDPQYEAVCEDLIKNGFGCLSYVNKYQRIAMDFIDRYPLTRFMDGEQIDYETSYVKDGVDINVLLIGFGKTNQQIFLTSVANNQFITGGEKGPELKKVNYHVFDKNHAENNKNLNHNYYRYKFECGNAPAADYLEFPDDPAKEFYHYLNVNDVRFYNEIRGITTQSPKSVNFIVLAFGTDLENIDMAQKLIGKAKEWGIPHLTVFVKTRQKHECKFINGQDCIMIANENEAVYDVEGIVGDKIFQMAQLRNDVYNIENKIKKQNGAALSEETVREIKKKAKTKWYVKLSQMERDSNLYCCLSLRMKLNLMGLDYCDKTDDTKTALTEEEYMQIYAKGDLPDAAFYSVTADGKPIIHYTIDFRDSRRRALAIHEHLRWNSYMISKGTIPATIKTILEEECLNDEGQLEHTNGKNYALRRHGNLTTYDGLVKFRQMIAERDHDAEENTDVFKYDYQLLDDAYWFLDTTGQKIYKIQKEKQTPPTA